MGTLMGVDRSPAARRLWIGVSLEASVRGTKGSTAPALRMSDGRPLRSADGYRMTYRKSITGAWMPSNFVIPAKTGIFCRMIGTRVPLSLE
jgi:hypothetical protein